MTLTGQFQHSLDAKGRVNFPAKLRDELGERFYITKGLENALAVYPLPAWEEFAAKIHALPYTEKRKLQKFFISSATELEPDKQGRVLIPAVLREYAGLDKEIVIAGFIDHVEIWNSERWDEHNDSLDSDTVAELMDSLGF